MTHPFVVRLLRYFGWIVLAGSVGVFFLVVIVESSGGPVSGQSLWPTPRLWRCFQATVLIAAGAACISLVLAVPPVIGLLHARRRSQKALLLALVILPLLIMPNVFSYGWMVMAMSRSDALRSLMDAVGWNAPGAPPFKVAWILGTWLWPIPALVLVAGYRQAGATGFRLASLDASPTVAFLRGALPEMRPALLASAGTVFLLAANDATVSSLMMAGETWSYTIMTDAGIALGHERPSAFMFWRSWPMMLAGATAIAWAAPGIRQMASWAGADNVPAEMTSAQSSRWAWPLAVLVAASLAIVPIAAFVFELWSEAEPVGAVAARAFDIYRRSALGTGLVALLTAMGAFAVGIVVIDLYIRCRSRWIVPCLVLILLLAAAMPPELIGIALKRFYSLIGSPRHWNILDDSPFAWSAAMSVRFGFVPACVAYLLIRRMGPELLEQAKLDGAGPGQCLGYAVLPLLWRPLVAAGMIVACLTVSEVACTVLIQPTRFFGGSLAIAIDNQMHYGRQTDVIASSLMLMSPAVAIAIALPWVWRQPPVLHGKLTTQSRA